MVGLDDRAGPATGVATMTASEAKTVRPIHFSRITLLIAKVIA
jgi:hypothetical protein